MGGNVERFKVVVGDSAEAVGGCYLLPAREDGDDIPGRLSVESKTR